MHPSNESKLRTEFSIYSIESWSSWQLDGELRGTVVFRTFDETFRLLTTGSNTDGVFLFSIFYVDWCWIQKQNLDNIFFKSVEEKLNDDCKYAILNYLDPLHIIFFATINDNFCAIAKEKLKTMKIRPSTVGIIDLMNFRYILNWCGDSLEKLYLSIHCFRSNFCCHSSDRKKHILEIILFFAGENLKFLHLERFDSIDDKIENLLIRRRIQVEIEISPQAYSPTFNSSFLGDKLPEYFV